MTNFVTNRFFGVIQVTAYSAAVSLVVHFLVCWLFVNGLKLGVVGTMATISISWWVNVSITLAYSVCGGCPLTWTGLSSEAFTGLWEFLKLSASSGVMLWYHTNIHAFVTLSNEPVTVFNGRCFVFGQFGKLVLSDFDYSDWKSSKCSNSR